MDRKDQGAKEVETKALREVQAVNGMILWLARWFRIDLGFSASVVGSRATLWTKIDQKELENVVNYIEGAADVCSVMGLSNNVIIENMGFAIATDSDHGWPGSQSGAVI